MLEGRQSQLVLPRASIRERRFAMADCEGLPRCPFFNDTMHNMPAAANLLQKRLCQGDTTRCARHMVLMAKGREKVPADLAPHQVDRAEARIGPKG